MEEKKVKDPYAELGVSSKKEGVHKATKNLDKGLYPGAFCQIEPFPSVLPKRIQDKYAQVIHSDGVGTKSNVAYIAMKEGLGTDYLRRVPQDALVMNTDDMACVGITNDIYISSHIARNANRVDDEAIAEIIAGHKDFYDKMNSLGINLYNAGGETADVGSYTTTLGIDVTATAIIEKRNIIDASNIAPGNYIVGLASDGMANYEDRYNSGIRSNGLTLAINALLSSDYRKYTETMDGTIDPEKLFTGKYHIEDKVYNDSTIADLILSPTRTYLPVLKDVLGKEDIKVNGIIHCSGGGLTKSNNFGDGIAYIKDNLPSAPIIFDLIKEERNIEDEYMYQTFNMGIGMEIIVPTLDDADKVRSIANSYGISAGVIGQTAPSKTGNVVEINKGKTYVYKK